MKSFCISHVKDVDGVSSAGIVIAATGAELLLSDYSSLIEDLQSVPKDVEQFVLCDLGSDNSNVEEFIAVMGGIAARARVTYIDHHYMSDKTKRRLRRCGVNLVHDEAECSGMLAYMTFRSKLPERARMLALLGAVTDYLDDSPMAKKLMEQADRQFILLEASMLAYALGYKGDQRGFPEMVAQELSRMKHPHEIEGVPGFAVDQLAQVVRLGEEVKRDGRKKGRIAYMVTSQHSTGNVAKLLIGAFEVPVGVAMKEQDEGWYEVSLRSTSECKVHLGKLIDRVATKLGGSGGGHRKAAGCRIPKEGTREMLDALAAAV